MQAKRALSLTDIEYNQIVLYTVEDNKEITLTEEFEKIADVKKENLFAIENRENISKEDMFLLFIKVVKTGGQPFDLNIVIEVHSVHLVNKKDKVYEKVRKEKEVIGQIHAELSTGIEEVPKEITFYDLFKKESGTVIIDGGKSVITEYYNEVKKHKVMDVYINGLLLFHLWYLLEWTEEKLQKALVEKVESEEISIKNIDNDNIYTETTPGYFAAQYVYLGKETENINLIEKKKQ